MSRGLEVGESNSMLDFFRNKYRESNDEHAKFQNVENIKINVQ